MDFAELNAIAADYWQPGGQPSLAFGVVRDGELVHSGGFGQRFLGGPAPDADTVFRISSMTKSFTAAAVLLRDEGLFALAETFRSCTTPADIPVPAATCGGTRPPAPALSPWPTAPTPRPTR